MTYYGRVHFLLKAFKKYGHSTLIFNIKSIFPYLNVQVSILFVKIVYKARILMIFFKAINS